MYYFTWPNRGTFVATVLYCHFVYIQKKKHHTSEGGVEELRGFGFGGGGGGGVEAERIVPFEWCSENGARDGEERGRERGEKIETVKNTKKLFSRDPSIQYRL